MNQAPRIALARVDDLLGKVFVLGMVLLAADVVQNAFRQINLLNQFWFWLTFSSLIVSIVGSVLAAFVFGYTRYWYRAIVTSTLFTLLTWGFQMPAGQVVQHDFKPWIWWALGFATLAAFGAWSNRIAYSALVIGPVLWLVVETSPEGGGAPLGLAIQDSLYSFFFSAALALMVVILRERAKDADDANDESLRVALRRVRLDVLHKERAIYNSIMHDRVLDVLESASSATTSGERKAAATAAADAIARLNREVERGYNPPEDLPASEFAKRLTEVLGRQIPEIKFTVTGQSAVRVPFEVAAALGEACILAGKNSISHAPNATERRIRLTLRQRGVKVVVSDNGGGFRMSNVHKTALGVRWTIFERLESVGVKANLESKLGVGTTWIFEWQS